MVYRFFGGRWDVLPPNFTQIDDGLRIFAVLRKDPTTVKSGFK